MKKQRLLAILIFTTLSVNTVLAKDYGIYGATYEIKEEGFLSMIHRKLKTIDMQPHQKKMQETARRQVEEPAPNPLVKRSKKMGRTLYPYTSKGIHGKYFAENRDLSFKKQITVFEFEEIKNDTGLLAVMLQVIGMQIFLQILREDHKIKFILIVNKSWGIIDDSGKFLAELVTTLKRYGGSVVLPASKTIIIQSIEHPQTMIKNNIWSLMFKGNDQGFNSFKGCKFKEIIPLIRAINGAEK